MSKKNYAKKVAKDYNILTRLYQCYAMYVLFTPFSALFYDIKFYGAKNLPKDRQFVYAANHISYLDPFLVIMGAGRKMGFMAKKELFKEGSWLGRNIFRLGAFAVNREKPEVSTIKSSMEAFKAGWGMCIFPQGGIRKNRKIEAVNKGFANIAKMANADILPISITGLECYNWNILKRVRVEVKLGTPIPWELPAEEIIENWRKQVACMANYELCDFSNEPSPPAEDLTPAP